MNGAATEVPGLGGSLAASFVALGVVCLLAYVVLQWLGQRGVGRATGAVRVLARCSLEPKRTVYIVEAAGRCFLLGVGDGPMTMLAELDRQQVIEREAQTGSVGPSNFKNVLSRFLKR